MKKGFRRIASHMIRFPDGSCQNLMVMEIESGKLTRYYPLTEEWPNTEWLPGEVCLMKDDEGRLCAYYEGKKIE